MTRISRKRLTSALLPPTVVALVLALTPSADAAPAPAKPTYGDLVVNGSFTGSSTGWWNGPGTTMAATGGALKVGVAAGTANPWDAVVGQDGPLLRKGVAYTLSFDARASAAGTRIRSTVQLGAAPWTAPLDRTVELDTANRRFTFSFVSTVDAPAGQVTFQVGGRPAAVDVTFDNVELTTSTAREGFYVDPNNNAATWVAQNPGDPRAARIRTEIAEKAAVKWFGDWTKDVTGEVSAYTTGAAATGKVPVLVAYNIPGRDCGGSSGGGSADAVAYKKWIDAFVAGIGDRPAVVILEPDAVAQSADASCISGDRLEARFDMLWYANQHLKAQNPLVKTYLDAGNAGWTTNPGGIGLARMAYLLNRSGVSMAQGVSVNVSNFDDDAISDDYGRKLTDQVFRDFGVRSTWVVDSARNGNGGWRTPGDPSSGHVGYCNPTKRKLGIPSRLGNGTAAEAYLWIKHPGDSDGDKAGECPAGSPKAGAFSPELATALIEGR
ncbi:glycoside hydrolase family 6 protein (plasmid) [Streptomyces sp. BI20]|uniref:glycoside hydrolase family 6 protein n=1 Tax=Streptomyces sp. BI20 TaxID=3403460 RepID=UPI003C74D84F